MPDLRHVLTLSHVLTLCCLVALISPGCPAPSQPDPAAAPTSPVRLATCEAPLGGLFPLPADTAVEAVSGYDEQVAALDLAALPAQLDLSYVDPFQRAFVAYMLDARPETLGESLNRDELLDAGPMGRAIASAFAVAAERGEPWLDFDTLRRGLFRYYACSRAFPVTLDGFERAYSALDSLPVTGTIASSPKGGLQRRIREDLTAGIRVAETLEHGVVRETEIQLQGRRFDGALDFLVYGEDGRLSDRSRFQTPDGQDISGAAPYTCLTCHLDVSDFSFDVAWPGL